MPSSPKRAAPSEKPMDKIIIHDISHYQGDLTKYWPLFKAKGVKGIIIQSSNGLAYQQYFKYAAKAAKENGFLVGSYHYYRQQIQNSEGAWYTCDPLKQANNYFNWVTKCGVVMDFPPALDVENGGNPYLSASGVEKTLGHIERLFGRVPMIYSNPSILRGLAKAGWERYPLWIAHYADKPIVPKPWEYWTLWQYSDKITYTPEGSIAKKPIDHNYFYGSEIDLYEFCFSDGEPPIEEPMDKYVRVKVPWLRVRSRPELYPGDTLVVGQGVLLKVTGEKVTTDITYYPIEIDGYKAFVSAGTAFTQLI